jgi:hypothetical protein
MVTPRRVVTGVLSFAAGFIPTILLVHVVVWVVVR